MNDRIDALDIFEVIHPLCHQVQRNAIDEETKQVTDTIEVFPALYVSNGEFDNVLWDSQKSVCYLRRNGVVNIEENEEYEVGCEKGIIRTFPIKIVGLIYGCDTDDSYRDEKQVENIIHAIQYKDNKALDIALDLESIRVKIINYNVNRYEVVANEFQNVELTVPFESIIFELNIEIIIESETDCWESFDCEC